MPKPKPVTKIAKGHEAHGENRREKIAEKTRREKNCVREFAAQHPIPR